MVDHEIWQPLNDTYAVSSHGNVKNIKTNRLLKTWLTVAGYPSIEMWKNNKRKKCLIHRLVAQAFIPNPENKPEVNHKDGIVANNHISNLEWCTSRENKHHSKRISRNGAVVSVKKIIQLYEENPKLSLKAFTNRLIAAAN